MTSRPVLIAAGRNSAAGGGNHHRTSHCVFLESRRPCPRSDTGFQRSVPEKTPYHPHLDSCSGECPRGATNYRHDYCWEFRTPSTDLTRRLEEVRQRLGGRNRRADRLQNLQTYGSSLTPSAGTCC